MTSGSNRRGFRAMDIRRLLGWIASLAGCLVFISPLLRANISMAATHYVATTGSDINPGTIFAPFRTIEKAAVIVTAGDTVLVRDGTYTDTDGDGRIVKLTRGGQPGRFS